MITLKLKNEKKILAAFKKAPSQMAKEIQKAMQKTAIETTGKVKQVIYSGSGMWKSPVDTGQMVKGIYAKEVKPLKAVITPSSSTPYAKYVHEGTKRMRARPFFEITAKKEKKNIVKFFQKAIDNSINKLKF